ncbi:50S ribosome-binding GTPase [Candidatus Woesearchaeota archaeon]|nr:50S ribosome-binding GTPase [Candidatus Woesearchaeota archaeon]
MSFAKIRPIERAAVMIDIAFRKGATRVAKAPKQSTDYTKRIREVERMRMEAMCNDLKARFNAILHDFPQIDELTPFYHELVLCTMDYDEVKKSLGAMNWALERIERFSREYTFKVTKCEDTDKMKEYRKQLYGRIASIVKQVDKHLLILDSARKTFMEFPVIKNIPTVAIVGFPNVGKTTLLSRLTGSTPEIDSYAFTTKTLNVGYLTIHKNKIQFIDTPGTLNRFNRMNNIEKQAYLAMKHIADLLVYVFDPTEEYPMHEQVALYKTLREFNKPIVAFVSKTDIIPDVSSLESKYSAMTDLSILKRLIEKKFSYATIAAAHTMLSGLVLCSGRLL